MLPQGQGLRTKIQISDALAARARKRQEIGGFGAQIEGCPRLKGWRSVWRSFFCFWGSKEVTEDWLLGDGDLSFDIVDGW